MRKIILSLMLFFITGIVFPIIAHAQCANPAGVTGDMTYNDDEHVMQWCDNTNWWGVGRSPYIPNGVSFRKADFDRLSLASDLTGVSDTKTMTGSFWYKNNDGGQQVVFHPGNDLNTDVRFEIFSGGTFRLAGSNSANSQILRLDANSENLYNNSWNHLLFSIDMSNSSNRHIYLNGSAVAFVATTYIDDFLDITEGSFNIGGNGAYFLGADIADLWIDFDTYIDFSVVANRRQFIDANGWPVNLGADGSRPTGSAPDIFLSGDTATWHTNDGTGGGFTENGALTTSGSHPAELFGSLNGLIAWWKLDETSGTTAFDSSGNGNDGTLDTGPANYSFDAGIIDGGVTNLTVNQNNALRIAAPIFPTGVNDPFTVTGWLFRNNNNACGAIWGVTGNGHNTGAEIYLRDDGNNISVNGNGLSSQLNQNSSAYDQDEWVLTTVTFDGTTLSVYADTTLINSGARTIDVNDSINYFNIGSADGSCGGGVLATYDDFRLYNRALSLAEITEIYDSGYPCKNPTAQRDGDTMYNTTHHIIQYCNNREWKAMSDSPGDGDPACDTIGEVCPDGSVFAGISPDGNINMYTTPANAPGTYAWNNANTAGKTTTGTTGDTTGQNHTNIIVNTDSDSGIAGIQPHQAAQYCYDLTSHSQSDWYLPSRDELNVLYTNRVTIGGFTADWYWNTKEINFATADRQNMSSGVNSSGNNKEILSPIRCVRKGQTTGSCLNPAGNAGDIMYNSTTSEMQYCEGNTWRAIGKYN